MLDVHYDDGTFAAITEKNYSEFNAEGLCTLHVRREEPQSIYYQLFEQYTGPRCEMQPRTDDSIESPFEALCYELSAIEQGERIKK